MSWGISPNAEEKEKIFADFADCLNGINCAGGLSYSHYSEIFDYGRKLADEEYQQGRADAIEEFATRMKEELRYFQLTSDEIDEIAEQLNEKQ